MVRHIQEHTGQQQRAGQNQTGQNREETAETHQTKGRHQNTKTVKHRRRHRSKKKRAGKSIRTRNPSAKKNERTSLLRRTIITIASRPTLTSKWTGWIRCSGPTSLRREPALKCSGRTGCYQVLAGLGYWSSSEKKPIGKCWIGKQWTICLIRHGNTDRVNWRIRRATR